MLGFKIEGSIYFDKHSPLASAMYGNILESLVRPISVYYNLNLGFPIVYMCLVLIYWTVILYWMLWLLYKLVIDINLPIKFKINSSTYHYNYIFGYGSRFRKIQSEIARRQTCECEKQISHFQKEALCNLTNLSLKICVCFGEHFLEELIVKNSREKYPEYKTKYTIMYPINYRNILSFILCEQRIQDTKSTSLDFTILMSDTF